jgi:Mrp family chromosome partitioning ATPase
MAATRELDAPLTVESLFRDLYTRLDLGAASARQILGVTSAINGEGRTTVASLLALTLARDLTRGEAGARRAPVLLIDTSAGKRSATSELRVRQETGLVQFLRGERRLEESTGATAERNLFVMPAGGDAGEVAVAIRGVAPERVREQLLEHFHTVVIDMPAILNSTDTRVLASLADHLALVVRAGVTPQKLIGDAVAEIGEERFAGVILNHKRRELPGWLEQRW